MLLACARARLWSVNRMYAQRTVSGTSQTRIWVRLPFQRARSITNSLLLCEHMLRLHSIDASIEFRIGYLWIARSNWKCRWIRPKNKQPPHSMRDSPRCEMENIPVYLGWAQNIHTFVHKCTTIQGFACIGHSQQDFRFIKFENYKLPVFTSRKYLKFSARAERPHHINAFILSIVSHGRAIPIEWDGNKVKLGRIENMRWKSWRHSNRSPPG